MWTINYKGYTIHGYCDRDECRWHDCRTGWRKAKSLHAAKCAITSNETRIGR